MKASKSTSNIVPVDNRKYKGQTLTEIVDVYTFSPRVNPKTKEIAEKRAQRIKSQLRKSGTRDVKEKEFADKYKVIMYDQPSELR